MSGWDEFVGFVRGTRPRPPPGPKHPWATGLLVTASVLHLPLVYEMVASGKLAPPIPLIVGFLSMGLAWASGVSLEGRRVGTTRALAALGVAEGGFALMPDVEAAIGPARWLFVVIAALCVGAIGVVSTPAKRVA